MGSSSIDIVIKAIDKASAEFKKVEGASTGLKDSMKLLGGVGAVAGVALAAVTKTIADGNKLIMDQAKKQRDLARTIGSTVTQAGMLIEAADDMMVSQATLTTAMETAIRKGYSPTISGLGTIADKYNAIQDPIAKAKYLMDTFGRAGADMAPLMAVGREGLEAMGESALRNGQVISESQARLARESEKSSDALGDSWDTLRKRMAMPFLPIKIFIEEHITKVIEDANKLDYAVKELGLDVQEFHGQMIVYDQFGKVIARNRQELEAYVAQQMLRVRWDETALDAIERLRAGMALKPADWLQNTTTIHTTIEAGGGPITGLGGTGMPTAWGPPASEAGGGGGGKGSGWITDKGTGVTYWHNIDTGTYTPTGQHGLDMIFPPGYPADSGRVAVSSGEHVQVTPPGEQPKGGSTFNNCFNVTSSPLDTQYVVKILKAAVGM